MSTHVPVHRLIDEQVKRTPQAIAVSSGGRDFSYGELGRRTDAIARRLCALGLGAEDLVGVLASRSIDTLVAMIGALKSGAGYVVFNPLPASRADTIRERANLRVFVGNTRALDTLSSPFGVRVPTDSIDSGAELDFSAPLVHPDNAAYVIFTSGTTGTPKGIVISHASLAHSTAARRSVYPMPFTAYLMLAPLAFDAAVAGIYITLSTGGRLVLPTDEEVVDPGLIADLIGRERVTHIDCVPSQYAVLVAYEPEALLDLTCVVLAGEAFPTSLLRRHFEVAPNTSIFNEYGPAEVTVWSAVHRVMPGELSGVTPTIVPIGHGIANTDVRILDTHLADVAEGEVGEISVAGPGVARGYLADPALTAAKFVPDRDPAHPGRRIYLTGDLGCWEGGVLHYRGRTDRMVKVRGSRVELDEVEAHLSACPALTGAAVVAVKTDAGVRLVAFILPRTDRPTVRELRGQLLRTLPDYMVPHEWRSVAALPMTTNGKLDHARLQQVVIDGNPLIAPVLDEG